MRFFIPNLQTTAQFVPCSRFPFLRSLSFRSFVSCIRSFVRSLQMFRLQILPSLMDLGRYLDSATRRRACSEEVDAEKNLAPALHASSMPPSENTSGYGVELTDHANRRPFSGAALPGGGDGGESGDGGEGGGGGEGDGGASGSDPGCCTPTTSDAEWDRIGWHDPRRRYSCRRSYVLRAWCVRRPPWGGWVGEGSRGGGSAKGCATWAVSACCYASANDVVVVMVMMMMVLMLCVWLCGCGRVAVVAVADAIILVFTATMVPLPLCRCQRDRRTKLCHAPLFQQVAPTWYPVVRASQAPLLMMSTGLIFLLVGLATLFSSMNVVTYNIEYVSACREHGTLAVALVVLMVLVLVVLVLVLVLVLVALIVLLWRW